MTELHVVFYMLAQACSIRQLTGIQ